MLQAEIYCKIDNITHTFEKNIKIFQNLNLNIYKNKINTIVGESGSGKTTLLEIITKQIHATSGNISFNQKKPQIRYVFQDPCLFPHLTVEKNIMLTHSSTSLFNEIMSIFNIKHLQDKLPEALSGGEAQRVCIARALYNNPDLLILDESFSNLDNNTKFLILDDLKDYLQKNKITTILVTHDPSIALGYSDIISVIHDKKIIQCSEPYDIYHKPACTYIAGYFGKYTLIPITDFNSKNLTTQYFKAAHQEAKTSSNHVLIRPDDIQLSAKNKADFTEVQITNAIFSGSKIIYELYDKANKTRFFTEINSHDLIKSKIAYIKIDPDHLVLL